MRFFRQPSLLFKLCRQIIWQGAKDQNQVYLSFDDGPHPIHTPAIMDILNQEQVPATFFVLGYKAIQHPELVRRIHQAGHQIGIHGFQHERLFHQSVDYLSQQLVCSKSAVEAIIGEQVQLFRPPFGIFSPRLLNICNKLRLKMVLWSLSPYDFDIKLSDHFIINLVHQKVTEGDIILLHDGHLHSYRTVRILHSMIQLVKSKGLKFGLIIK